MKLHRLFVLAVILGIGGIGAYGILVADNGDEGEQEQTVSLGEVPDAVKATMLAEILSEVDDLKLEEIELETEGGKTAYEADFEYQGKEFELLIAVSGQLLAKEVEDEDDEEDEDKDDEDG